MWGKWRYFFLYALSGIAGGVTVLLFKSAALGASGPAGYRALALMQQGNIRLGANKYDEAAGFYDRAAKAAPNPIFRDAAELLAALALLDTAPYPQLNTRLTALIGPNKPFDLQAREALAMAKLAAGKVTEARGDLNARGCGCGRRDRGGDGGEPSAPGRCCAACRPDTP